MIIYIHRSSSTKLSLVLGNIFVENHKASGFTIQIQVNFLGFLVKAIGNIYCVFIKNLKKGESIWTCTKINPNLQCHLM